MQAKPKVLMILHIPPPINGAAMVGKYVTESVAINKSSSIDYINLTTSFELGAIGKGNLSKLFIILKIVRNTFSALLSKRYDLCYMTLTAKGAGFYKDFLIVVLLKLFRRKIIFHFHNKGVKENSTSWFKKLLYRFAFKNTQSILLAPQLYDDVSDYIRPEDAYFCPNGIPALQKPIEPAITTENPGAVCKFLFLSNMMFDKGVFTLLDACKILKEQALTFECHFVGAWSDISENDFRQKLSSLGLTKNVFAHGPVYGDAKLYFFKDADVFVFPTFYHNEAFPLVNLEAMQMGLPVISTPEGGIPDMVIDGETGFLTSQSNVQELADKMALLIKKPILRKQMGAAGRKRYSALFTKDKFETKLIEIFTDTIANQ